MKQEQQNEKKTRKISGSVDQSYELSADEQHLVHYMLTDYSSPRPKDSTEEYKPQQRIVKVSPNMFVRQFAENYTGNGAFINVNTPSVVLAISKHVTEKEILEAYADVIQSATLNNPKRKREYVDNILKSKRKLMLSGGNQICTKVLHIPKNDTAFPFVAFEEFPKNCL